MCNIPDTIYLQIEDDGLRYNELYACTHCEDRINDSDIVYRREGSMSIPDDIRRDICKLIARHAEAWADEDERATVLQGADKAAHNISYWLDWRTTLRKRPEVA